jgi:hypothetical protein
VKPEHIGGVRILSSPRVTQAILERRRAAKQAEGSEIRPKVGATTVKHSGSLKFYVAADFRQQHPDWKERLLDLVDAVNGVLTPSFAVRLETATPQEWSPQCDGSELQRCLEELVALDAGRDDEWIVGVLAAQPRFVTNFEDLGRAAAPGRHMILRDVSDMAEHDAIGRAFPAMTQGRRDEIYRHRKRHKRLAIFLHEWAHTLGAGHSNESTSLLFPSYDDRMSSYDETTTRTLEAAIEPRFAARPEAAQASAAAPENTTAQPTSSTQSSSAASPAAGKGHPYAVRGADEEVLAELTPADRALYHQATQQSAASEAYATLEPLVERYPQSYAVQYLACGLLMQLGRNKEVQIVCTRVQTLAAGRH